MNNRNVSLFLRVIPLLFITAALVLTILQLINYSRLRGNYPPGMTIAGVPVGGLDPQTAAQRILQIYSLPVEVQYAGANIHIDPTLVGFELKMDNMLAAADLVRTGGPFWSGFWDYLWGRPPITMDVPLVATVSQERLRDYLKTEIASRYDQPATPAQPIPGSVNFTPGQPGQELDLERAARLVEDALRSPTNRTVVLTVQRSSPPRPSAENLKTLLKQIVELNRFDGVVGFYLLDLQNGQEVHFALRNNQEIPVTPDVAFTAASTSKIPIMVAYYVFNGPTPIDQQTSDLIRLMIAKSDNVESDALMERIDPVRGPLVVSETMQRIGLENTFMAGFFAPNAPLLKIYSTPANQRRDVFTDPDPYNQTTSSDMGMLLGDIYQCAQTGGGALRAAYPDRITQAACQQMISYLAQNKIGVLIEAGVPEGTQVAHKHGWVVDVDTGLMRKMADAGIVYTPGGNYVLSIYIFHPRETSWEQASRMFAELSQAVYNYFNLPTQ